MPVASFVEGADGRAPSVPETPPVGPVIFLVRFAALLLLVRIGVRFVGGLLEGLREPEAGRTDVEMVRDRVCNTFLPRHRALKATVRGREEHFCSPACRDRALSLVLSP